ncbi:hypothetical protein IE81DRAFT_226455 [Ceraceosorus guamensis]|uniref:Uncharacterized protein n=1 Tax=Ceraceosorus guamensis TaxID=1522189 RepID=A0A316WBT3_9BASI|nr:hypothetical protein IE81DRAFT_226455 [Ceraceosorus guamensis]PWN45035.1 hypothetical protein IE81DRAFT_226455 [Ceraceosorus guamensis]
MTKSDEYNETHLSRCAPPPRAHGEVACCLLERSPDALRISNRAHESPSLHGTRDLCYVWGTMQHPERSVSVALRLTERQITSHLLEAPFERPYQQKNTSSTEHSSLTTKALDKFSQTLLCPGSRWPVFRVMSFFPVLSHRVRLLRRHDGRSALISGCQASLQSFAADQPSSSFFQTIPFSRPCDSARRLAAT